MTGGDVLVVSKRVRPSGTKA